MVLFSLPKYLKADLTSLQPPGLVGDKREQNTNAGRPMVFINPVCREVRGKYFENVSDY